MIGFFGSRHLIDPKDGLLQQRITFPAPEDRKIWEAIFPPGQEPIVNWLNDMTLELGKIRHRIVCQTTVERDQWHKTFRIHADSGMKPFARWSPDSEERRVGKECRSRWS